MRTEEKKSIGSHGLGPTCRHQHSVVSHLLFLLAFCFFDSVSACSVKCRPMHWYGVWITEAASRCSRNAGSRSPSPYSVSWRPGSCMSAWQLQLTKFLAIQKLLGRASRPSIAPTQPMPDPLVATADGRGSLWRLDGGPLVDGFFGFFSWLGVTLFKHAYRYFSFAVLSSQGSPWSATSLD